MYKLQQLTWLSPVYPFYHPLYLHPFCTSRKTLRLPSFSHFPLHPTIESYLSSQDLHTPTYIQYSLLSSLEKHSNKSMTHRIISPTGSGKTLAYMIPLIDHLRKEEDHAGVQLTMARRPRGLVLTATKELVLQTRDVAKGITHFCKLKADGINIGRKLRQEREIIENGVDVLVSTFDRLNAMMRREEVFLSQLKWVVIDEIDTLFQTGKLDIIDKKILQPLLARQPSQLPQLILAGTTISPILQKTLNERFPEHIALKDQKTHINLQNIKHQFIHCLTLDKHQYLVPLLAAHRSLKTLIFCTTASSLHELEYFLNDKRFKPLTLHSRLSKNVRLANYEHFRDSDSGILISTDLGARGLHFPNLDRVINYDFPLSTCDYLQRAGRTGRAGKPGQVVTLYHARHTPILDQLRGCSFKLPLKISNSAYGFKNREETGKPNKYVKK